MKKAGAKGIKAEKIKEYLDQRRLVIGTDRTISSLKRGRLEAVFITTNTPERVIKDIRHYAGISNAKVVPLKIPNEEFGIVCKKQYPISVAGVVKA